MTKREQKALLYAASLIRRHRSPLRYNHRLWWEAIDLLPDPVDMPYPMLLWASIAESMAFSRSFVVRR
jgi:hypothetical protein